MFKIMFFVFHWKQVCNLGGNWPSTLALWSVDSLTWKSCRLPDGGGESIESNMCRNPVETQACTDLGGHCGVDLDGYYVESLICIVIGLLWLRWGKRTIEQLQKEDSAWKVVS